MLRKDRKFRRKLLVTAFAGALIGSGFVQSEMAYAGLNSILQGMLVAAGSPADYSDQQGEVLAGGYMNVSVPDQQYNVISFAPPNLSGGCGGINLFMGSFSFISASQFEKMLEQIGEGLLTYAFYTAISSMCSTCTTILQTLENAMQTMNNAMRNTCELSTGVGIKNFAQSMGQAAHEFDDVFTGQVGLTHGLFSSVKSGQANPGSILSDMWTDAKQGWNQVTVKDGKVTTSTVTKNEPLVDQTPGLGNNTWRALLTSQAQGIIGSSTSNTLGTNDTTAMEMLMSLIGTDVVNPASVKQDNTDDSNVSQSSNTDMSSSSGKFQSKPYAPTINLEQLVNGSPDSNIYTCEKPADSTHACQYGISSSCDSTAYACLKLGNETFSAIGFYGLRSYIKARIYGGSYGTTTYNGYVSDMMDNKFSTGAQDFFTSLPFPMIALGREVMTQAAMSPAMQRNYLSKIAHGMEPFIVDDEAIKLGDAVISAADLAFANAKQEIHQPKYYWQHVQAIQSAINVYRLAAKRQNARFHRLRVSIAEAIADHQVKPTGY